MAFGWHVDRRWDYRRSSVWEVKRCRNRSRRNNTPQGHHHKLGKMIRHWKHNENVLVFHALEGMLRNPTPPTDRLKHQGIHNAHKAPLLNRIP